MKKTKVMDIYIDMFNAFHEQVDPRRKQELKDSRMVPHDRSSIANLPREFKLHEFNAYKYVERLDDYDDGVE